ncbi:L,D-transpeptidase family protein [Nocardioides rotundus]|uniref:L,D-transpeptidase n=1 Tax=Nocardioides rotundus TaxID=1774216 RepID=UPI001CBCC656|nr:Ig-like domain-containing protein [Nocardioides rotundus]UAL30948.1 L,D-transpeptidase family protein [Nocardioides rotundus]
MFAEVRARRWVAGLGLAALPLLAACSGAGAQDGPGADRPAGQGASPSAEPAKVELTTNLAKPRQVAVDQVVEVGARNGTLTSVQVRTGKGRKLAGELDGETWTATGRLEPGTTYHVKAVAERGADGRSMRSATTFRTADLSLDEQTYASVAPLQGETVGVGMPVVVSFDIPVQNKKAFEKHMSVTSSPQQKGSWHWMSDTEAHWRPAKYWQPGTDVSVDVDVNSVPAGNGIYGQESRKVDFTVGDAVISKVDMASHQMKTFINGELAKTTPITTGKPGFTTRSGVKVIMEKFDSKRMNSETIGIDPSSAEGYDLNNVQWAMRVTSSGEFLHSAPWSVGSQGYANVSHGCTGMSPENAKWLYDLSKRGDVVEYTGSDRPMTVDNGYGDWNLPFQEYAAGSALG